MKNKYYKAFVINDDNLETMIVDGYCKKNVKTKIVSFYMKSNKIKDYKKFYIFLVRVEYINGEYIDV